MGLAGSEGVGAGDIHSQLRANNPFPDPYGDGLWGFTSVATFVVVGGR